MEVIDLKRTIIIGIVVIMLGWAIYDFVIHKDSNNLGAGEGTEIDDLAPDFDIETLDGETVQLSDFRGKKVLLNFWATWCSPCREEIPDMQTYHEEEDEGVILAVNLTETETNEEEVREFLEDFDVTFTVLMDEESKVSTIYDAYDGLPTSYFIDSEGKIHNKTFGAIDYELIQSQFEEMD